MQKKTIFTFSFLFLLSHCAVFAQQQTNYQSKHMNKVNDNTIETKNIVILEKPQEKYVLELKNGKPFNGYEVTEQKLLQELPFVNYYENGILKAQYSVDFIEKDFYGKPLEYKFKTTFNKGKIVDGYAYRQLENNILLTDIYESGKKTGIEHNIFGENYFNRISYILKNHELSINNFDNKEGIRIYKKDGFAVADYLRNGAIIETSEVDIQHVSEADPFSISVYYLDKKDELQMIFLKRVPREPIETDDQFLPLLYMQFAFQYDGLIDDFFELIDEKYAQNNLKNINFESLFEQFVVPYQKDDVKGFLFYDSVGLVHEGIKIEKNKDGSYTAKTFHNGEVVKEDHIQNLRTDYFPY